MRYALPLLLAATLASPFMLPAQAQDPLTTTDTEILPVPKMTSLLFPVMGKNRWSDTFGAPRDGGRRKHQGQDIMAPKMTPLIAVFDGTVYLGSGGPGGHYTISLRNDEGWSAQYYHVNNDTPGAGDNDDGLGGDYYAFAPGLKSGDRVKAGQLVGFVGDSGNAENTGPHCHFELWYQGNCVNPALSLRKAQHIADPLANLTAPDLKPNRGEVRYDGRVRSVEGDLLLLDLAATTLPGKKPVASRKPAKRYVLLKDAKLHRRDDITQTLEKSDLQPGMSVTVLGKEQGKNRALLARVTAPEIDAIDTGTAIALVNRRNATQPNMTEMPVGLPHPSPEAPMPATDDTSEETPEPFRAPEPPKRAVRAEVTEPDAEIRTVVKRINAFRKASGLPELTLNAKLSKAARRHSKDMAEFNFCNHLGSDGSKVSDRVEDAGYSASRVVQNIAAGFDTPDRAVNAWEQDQNSVRNLRDGTFREIGVGWYRPPYGGRFCWTVVLAAP